MGQGHRRALTSSFLPQFLVALGFQPATRLLQATPRRLEIGDPAA